MPRCLLGLLALALVTACGDTERSADTIRIGMMLEPPNLDPTSGAAAATDEVVYANIFEGLVRVRADGSVGPALAKSWTVSEDERTYDFVLQDGVRFHDGTGFDSADVKFSLERARAPGSTNAQPALFAAIEDISPLSPTEIRITLGAPREDFLFDLAWGDAVIVAPESADSNARHPVGTGPFRFVRWQKGQRIRLERFDDYWGDTAPMAAAEFHLIPDSAAAYAALMAQDVDGFPNFPAPELLRQLRRNPQLSIDVGVTEGETILAMNMRRAPFTDSRVRRAISLTVDRNVIIEGAMYGYGTPIGSFFSPLHPAYVDLTDQTQANIQIAKALLAEAGYPNGFTTELKLPPVAYARRSGEIVAAQLSAIGITVKLRYTEWAQWLSQVIGDHSYDMTIVSHTEPRDIGIFARPDNYFGYDSPVFSALIADIAATTDHADRNRLYAAAQQQLVDDSAAIFLFQLPQLGVWRSDIAGYWVNAPIQATDATQIRRITKDVGGKRQ